MSKQVIGCSNSIIDKIIDIPNKTVLNTLIVSLPSAGKTTLLRDIARNISDGNNYLEGQTVGIVDERGEIAACYKGVPQNDVGIRTDVLSNVPKHLGIKMLIRSMAPNIIVVDEIGNEEDAKALHYAICSRN